jgi:hypothetical protein
MSARTRTAAVEWARRSAAGELDGLAWADGAVAGPDASFAITVGEDGEERFFHVALASLLPPAMAEAAAAASEAGRPTALEALQLLLARPQWLVRTRRLWWTPRSPAPGLLAPLVEAYGIPAEVHRDDPARLARIAARVARWWARRGELPPALELLREAADGDARALEAWSGAAPAEGLDDEVLACHDLSWWAERKPAAAALHPVIRDGLVRFQPPGGTAWEVLREDVVLTVHPDAPFDPSLLRMLPVWLSVRVVASPRDAR